MNVIIANSLIHRLVLWWNHILWTYSRWIWIYMLYVARRIKAQWIFSKHRLLIIIFIKSISRCNISRIIIASNTNMRVHITCKIIIKFFRFVCKLYLRVIVVVLWWIALVLYGFALGRLAEIFDKQHNTLQNSKRDHKGSKPNEIGLLGPDRTVMASTKR